MPKYFKVRCIIRHYWIFIGELKSQASLRSSTDWWEPSLWLETGFKSLTCYAADAAAAAAAAKSLQSCPTLCNPIDGSPPGSSIHWIFQARVLEWVAISLSNAWKWKVKVKSLSHVWLFETPWTAAHQTPPSMGFSRQECWSGVLLPFLWLAMTNID